tara:strand:+ start:506 stop:1279 length:774 start_codon:yes stop_codon:yes gene_type:complete
MKLVIDSREQSLIKLLSSDIENSSQFFKKEINVENGNLAIGDLIIYGDDGKELIIFERKSLADLASSISDGRYNEQSFRLNEHEVHNHNIVYIIEGDFNKFRSYGRIDSRALHSSIFNLMYYKGFSVYRTFNIQETSFLVCRFLDKLSREKTQLGYYNGNKEKMDNVHYSEVCKSSTKKSQITPSNIGIIMLMQIPCVSSQCAQAIMKNYETLIDLIVDLQDNPKCLDECYIINSSQQKRKINKTAIENIKKFLMNM